MILIKSQDSKVLLTFLKFFDALMSMAGSDSIFNPVVENEEANWWMTQLFTLVAGLGCGMIAHLLAKHFRGQAAPTRLISLFHRQTSYQTSGIRTGEICPYFYN